MLSILVVDDEKNAREQIEYTLTNYFAEHVVIETVSNGYKALEKIKQNFHDILITDVRMPKMDGITLVESVKKIIPEIKVIFTTAYADKEMLKSAIKFNTVSFVEKPIITSELITAVKKAAELIEQSEKSFSFNNSHVILLMAKKGFDKNQLRSVMGHSLFAKVERMKFKTVIIKCIPSNSSVFVTQADILNKMARMLNGRDFNCMYAFKTNDVLIAHFCFSSDISNFEKMINGFLEEFIYGMNDYNFFCCMGMTVDNIDHLYKSCEEAMICLEQSFFRDDYGIIYPDSTDDVQPHKNVDISRLYDMLKNGDKYGAFELINKLYATLLHSSNTLVSEAKNCYVDIVNQMFSFSKDYNLKFHEMYERNNAIAEVLSFQWLRHLNEYVCDLLQRLFDTADFTSKDYLLVQKITSFIEENYTDPSLSVGYIANYCALSPSYVSTVFKSKVGVTINTYINELRLKRAKMLFLNTNETLEVIALSSGYSSSNYFCKIFKKSTGMTPSEYKKNFKNK